MRILQICNKAPYPANDGSSIAIYNMAKGIIANEHELHLLTINTKKHFKNDSLVPQDFKERSHYTSIYKDTSPTPFGALLNLLLSSESYFICRFYFNEFENALVETLQKNKFDIVQLEGLFMAPYIPCIRQNSKAKIALRAHNIEHLIWQRHIINEKSWFKRWYLGIQNERLKKFEEHVFSQVDTIITITNADKQFILERSPKLNVFTSITGVDLKDYELNTALKKRNDTFFSFGSMDWMPNLEAVEWFFDKCWPKLHQKDPNCKFIIAGRHMPHKFKTTKLPNVEVVENVTNNRDFYSTYSIMIVPLLSGSGLRIKIVEGLAYGKAIISTHIGAEGIPVTNGEHMILADTPDDFVNTIYRLLHSDKDREQLELNAKKFASQHLDNKQITTELLDHYAQLN